MASFESWIGRRYVRSRNDNRFVSFISAISMAGIAIGVAVLIIVMSVVNGFEKELKDRLLVMSGHASIEGIGGQLTDVPRWSRVAAEDSRVEAAAPYVTGQALLTYGHSLSGAALKGVDPTAEEQVSGISGRMIDGAFHDLRPGEFGIVLGVELASALDVQAGDKVTATLAEGIVTPAGIVPRSKRFTVTGIYRAGMYEFDRRLAFINIADAQRLYRMGDRVSGVRLAVDDIYAAPLIVREVAEAGGGGVVISDWTRVHTNFFRSIQITKSILFVILTLVIAVAAFNIVSTLVMVVKDKQADIAILRTAGATPFSIVRIFVTQGSIIGVVGTAAGLLLGAFLTLNLEAVVQAVESLFRIKLLAADVYFISDLPADLRIADILQIGAMALLLSFFSTLYPAWRGASTAPAEALRYE